LDFFAKMRETNPANGVQVVCVHAHFVTDQKATRLAFMDAHIVVVESVRPDSNRARVITSH
jgi:hypothetical protein